MITDEIRRELEASYVETWDEEKQGSKRAGGSRFIRLPEADSHEGYRDREDIIFTVENKRLQDLLWRAFSGEGALRYFKDVLPDYPRQRKRWFKSKDGRVRQRILEWLESEGIEPIEE